MTRTRISLSTKTMAYGNRDNNSRRTPSSLGNPITGPLGPGVLPRRREESKATITTEDVAEIAKRKGSLHGLVTPLGDGIVVCPIDLPSSAQAAWQQNRLALKA